MLPEPVRANTKLLHTIGRACAGNWRHMRKVQRAGALQLRLSPQIVPKLEPRPDRAANRGSQRFSLFLARRPDSDSPPNDVKRQLFLGAFTCANYHRNPGPAAPGPPGPLPQAHDHHNLSPVTANGGLTLPPATCFYRLAFPHYTPLLRHARSAIPPSAVKCTKNTPGLCALNAGSSTAPSMRCTAPALRWGASAPYICIKPCYHIPTPTAPENHQHMGITHGLPVTARAALGRFPAQARGPATAQTAAGVRPGFPNTPTTPSRPRLPPPRGLTCDTITVHRPRIDPKGLRAAFFRARPHKTGDFCLNCLNRFFHRGFHWQEIMQCLILAALLAGSAQSPQPPRPTFACQREPVLCNVVRRPAHDTRLQLPYTPGAGAKLQ